MPEIGCASRDLLILVEQSAEPVAPPDVVNLGCCALGERSQGSGLAESAVRPVNVVVKFVLAKYGRGVAPIDDETAVEEFASDGADEASAMALARGARTGVRTIWMLVQGKTASKAAVNLEPRSRMRNRGRRPALSRSMVKLRAS